MWEPAPGPARNLSFWDVMVTFAPTWAPLEMRRLKSVLSAFRVVEMTVQQSRRPA